MHVAQLEDEGVRVLHLLEADSHFVTQAALPPVVVLGCGFSRPVCGLVLCEDLCLIDSDS